MGDDPLLEWARRGDRQALEDLCRREWRPVYALVYHAVRDRAEAEDLTQEVFLRALRSLGHYRATGAPFHAFLAAVARNLLRDRWRRDGRNPVELDCVEELQAGGGDPEASALAAAERARLRDALACLPPDYQAVLRLRVVEGRPTAEVAALLGRGPNAVRQLQHRALVALRARLREETSV